MTTGATGQLGLALPVQGELSGTWGDTVNNGITQYTNIAIAGTLTLTGDGAVTLANTTGDASASNITSTLAGAGTVTAQFAIVKVSGTTTTKVVTGPSYSKTYVVDNASSFAVTFKASGQTGVSIAAAEKVTVVFNGTDYIKLAGTIANAAGSNTQIQFNNSGLFGASANLTWDGTTLSSTQVNITGQGTLRLQDTTGGEYVGLRSPSALGASYTLTFPADDGTSGQALITDGSGVLSWSTAASGDVYGPGSSTDNAVARFDSTTGKLLQNSVVLIGDTGAVTGVTDLTTTGNTTLGDASTDTVTVNGYMGVGGAGASSRSIAIASTALVGTSQFGIVNTPTFNSQATSAAYSYFARVQTEAAAFTLPFAAAYIASTPTKGAGSTITALHGVYIDDQTQGTNNYGITSLVSSGSNKWNIYASGTADNYFAGNLGIGTSSPGGKLEVYTGASGATAFSNGSTLILQNSGAVGMSLLSPDANAARIYFGSASNNRNAFIYSDYNAGAQTLIFGVGTSTTAATERMRLDSAGTLFVNTTARPSGIGGGDNGKLWVKQTTTGNYGISSIASATDSFISIANTGTVGLIGTSYGTTGSYLPLAFYTSDLERARITASGDVGIGTSSPTQKLTVAGAINLSTDATNPNSGVALWSQAGIGATLSGFNIAFNTGSNGAQSERMRVSSAGDVGIGTSSPSVKLEVAGAAKLTGTNLAIVPSTATSAAYTVNTNTGGNFFVGIDNSTGASFGAGNYARVLYSSAAYPMAFFTNDLERMRILSDGNVGIGVTSPAVKLDVAGGSSADVITIRGRTSDNFGLLSFATSTGTKNAYLGSTDSTNLTFYTNGFNERMRITSAGLVGIGTTGPVTQLQVNSGSSYVGGFKSTIANGFVAFQDSGTSGALTDGNVAIGAISDALAFRSGGATRMRLDSAGNLGLGVTPNAWQTTSYQVLQIGATTSIFNDGGAYTQYINNAYIDSAYAWRYQTTSFATRHDTYNGQQRWFTAPSGTAGNTVTWTQAMTLNASGILLVGTTSAAASEKLRVTGTGVAGTSFAARFNQTNTDSGSATLLGLSVEGSSWSKGAIGFVRTGDFDVGSLVFCTNSNNTGGTDVSLTDERVRITSAGNLGVGTTSPSGADGKVIAVYNSAGPSRLVLKNNSTGDAGGDGFQLAVSGTTAYIEQREGSPLIFTTSNAEALRIDASGNVGIGLTAPPARLCVTAGAASSVTLLNLINNDNSFGAGTGAAISFGLSNSAAIGSFGKIEVLNTTGGSGSASYMAFSTRVSDVLAEKMRLDANGNLLIGQTTAAGGNNGIFLRNNLAGAGSSVMISHATGIGSGNGFMEFFYGASQIGSITQSGTTAVLYNTTSDQRLKENIVDAPEFGSVIDSIKVRSYDWKSDGSHQRAGFIAQELVAVAPEAVHQPANADEMMAVDYSKLVPMLVKEIQSLRKRLADAGI